MSSKNVIPRLDEGGFKALYEAELKPILIDLEEERKSIQNRKKLIIVIGVILGITGVIFMFLEQPLLFAAALLLFGLIAWSLAKNPESWKEVYKFYVIDKIIKFVDQDLQFDPEGSIDRKIFDATLLYKDGYTIYKTEDLVSGQTRTTNFSYCEIMAKTSGKDSVTMFNGIFMSCDFNKEFNGHYILKRDVADTGTLGKIASRFDKFDRIKLEDPRFEKIFDLRGEDQVEGRYIFSTSFMERLLELDQLLDHEFQLAFYDRKLYLAFSDNKDQYDHDFSLKADHYMHLYKTYKFTCQMRAIVDVLDLNNDIWKTKT